jgi:hypothetical protein
MRERFQPMYSCRVHWRQRQMLLVLNGFLRVKQTGAYAAVQIDVDDLPGVLITLGGVSAIDLTVANDLVL